MYLNLFKDKNIDCKSARTGGSSSNDHIKTMENAKNVTYPLWAEYDKNINKCKVREYLRGNLTVTDEKIPVNFK